MSSTTLEIDVDGSFTHQLLNSRAKANMCGNMRSATGPKVCGSSLIASPKQISYPNDFDIINYYIISSRASWFTFHVVFVPMIIDEKNEVVGDLTLFNNTLKRRIGAASEVLGTFTSEEEHLKRSAWRP
ncbi:hypothetical protein N7476_001813 [Penicillium atrosanguineum]|uniref:Uncharacterized protein n=1 Tax=Penicillium atrosanguineum TaxID=1132637 RepID=A0A9W9Q461_9EURO|nr:hypothetical protein N7526_006347 [Penicillium atrosanguineum]KAJ5323213.1 hypothetical protein N7476_001813 [Penicillium atrosanguineum]